MSSFRSKILIMIALMVVGCSPRAATPPKDVAEEGDKTNAKSASATSDDVLSRALFQLQPESFGLYSNVEKPVSLLNTWRLKRNGQVESTDQPVPVKAPTGWIPESDESRLAQAKFDLPDAVHVRDALLYHTVAGYLSDRARDEVTRVNAVVDFVCRNISLWKDDEIDLPLQPYIALLLGRGSADDRAWVCVEILRQLRLDSVIIRSKSDSKESSDKWLLGVLIEQKVYLYDLHLGMPLPSGDGSATAEFAEISAHPEWLSQLSTTKAYRLTADDFRDPIIFVVPDPNFWCQRMQDLEQVLPATDSCVLFDPLIAEAGKKGSLQRISTNGNWPIDSLKPWQHPQRQIVAAQNMNQQAQQEMSLLAVPLNVPIPFMMKDGKPIVGAPERKLQRFRTDQLLGKFTEATQRYLSIRHLEVEENPADLERLNRLAAQDAIYWTAVCKFELGDFEKAIEPISETLKRYDRKGRWFFPARLLLAQCYAEMKQFPEAIKTLERTSSDDPYREANAIRVKRWAAASK